MYLCGPSPASEANKQQTKGRWIALLVWEPWVPEASEGDSGGIVKTFVSFPHSFGVENHLVGVQRLSGSPCWSQLGRSQVVLGHFVCSVSALEFGSS